MLKGGLLRVTTNRGKPDASDLGAAGFRRDRLRWALLQSACRLAWPTLDQRKPSEIRVPLSTRSCSPGRRVGALIAHRSPHAWAFIQAHQSEKARSRFENRMLVPTPRPPRAINKRPSDEPRVNLKLAAACPF